MDGYPRSRLEERRRRHAAKMRRLKFFLLCMFISITSIIFYTGFSFNSHDLLDKTIKPTSDQPMPTSTLGSRTTIMLMGVDERKDDVGRSDTLMIVSLDSKNDRVSLLSIPRDTRVKIKKHGFDKINAAYAYGGHKLSKSTVENLLGIPIDHYVIVDTGSFSKIIDARNAWSTKTLGTTTAVWLSTSSPACNTWTARRRSLMFAIEMKKAMPVAFAANRNSCARAPIS